MDIAASLKAFQRTVERGSLTAAAGDLDISQPAVSKLLANLEHHVQARLLERTTRHVRPTPEGQALYEATRTAVATIDAALEGARARPGTIEGLIRIHAPSCMGFKNVHPIVMDFQRRHPNASVELILENRVVDLVFENFDLAVRYGRPEGQEVVIRRIGEVRRLLVATPDFVGRFGPIDTPERLAKVPLVTTPAVLSARNVLTLHGAEGAVDVSASAILKTNDAHVISGTVLSGHAAGPVQQLLIADDLRAGRLVHLLPDHTVKPSEAFVAYPSIRYMRPVVRAFADHLIEGLAVVEGIAA